MEGMHTHLSDGLATEEFRLPGHIFDNKSISQWISLPLFTLPAIGLTMNHFSKMQYS
jgi:hypothetical protein